VRLLSARRVKPDVRKVAFASTNENKYREVRAILAQRGLEVEFAKAKLVEIQSDSLEAIAREKAKSAYLQVSRSVIVEDDGLFIDSLGGFPGQYSSYVFKSIGIAGIVKLLSDVRDRYASFISLIAFSDGKATTVFEGKVNGAIADKPAAGGWGYDPIFVPDGASGTFAELANKNDYSHRRKALDLFADWYLRI
jgi:XTP/dITP diphosphohydrolase